MTTSNEAGNALVAEPPKKEEEEKLSPAFFFRSAFLARTFAFTAVFTLIQILYNSIAHAAPLNASFLGLSVAGGIVLGFLLGGFLWRATVARRRSRIAFLWLALFIVQMFADLIEGAFFTTAISSPTIFVGGTIIAAVVTLAEALAAVYLFRSPRGQWSAAISFKSFFATRSATSWASRLIVGSFAYFPIYFFFGALVSPIVIPYYTNPSNGLGLAIPPFSLMIPVELLRGALFVVALVPLIAISKLSNKALFVFLTMLLYVAGAFIPFVVNTDLPSTLKTFHSLEIIADSLVYSFVLTYLFNRRK